jgi:CHASE1-domain containing sensor protein
MMTLVEKGKDYRIFKGNLLFVPYYVVEDTSNATQKGGVWNGVKFTTHYFKSLKTVKKTLA